MILPLFIGRSQSLAAVQKALEGDRMIMLASQKEPDLEHPSPDDIYGTGCVGMIMRSLKLPDGRTKVLVQGLGKARIRQYLATRPFFSVSVEDLDEPEIPQLSLESEALMRTVRDQLNELQGMGRTFPNEVVLAAENVEDPGGLADVVASNLGLKVGVAQQILEEDDPVHRLHSVKELLAKETELVSVQHRIQNQAREEMSRSQREYFLREQLRAIQSELGETDAKAEDLLELRAQIDKAKLPAEVGKEAHKQLRRLETMPVEAAEYSMLRTYLEWLAELPWQKRTRDSIDLSAARRILDEDHYDLEKVKERILEFLAVCKLKKKLKGPVLCFVGPPGVGKTSLGKSVARALGRKFVRVSLGGLRDEAEIRGHRRTYVGALPGRIIQSMKQAGSNNPVFMLDELDKVGGADFRGDPSAALLELLDPEQNHAFSDHYINLPFDLSKVLFIATANVLDSVPSALKDRLEVIRLAGYSTEQKLAIARRYLIPRQLEANGLQEKDLSLSRNAVLKIIGEYTAEAGLRNLERELGSVCRKVALRRAEDDLRTVRVTAGTVAGYLGPPRYLDEDKLGQHEVGVATGLAWTEVGGQILHIEASIMPGSGQLHLTGQLGDVMKESAQAALSYARAHAGQWGIDADFHKTLDIHIHVPAGAIPKDGPSAGVTMVTALVSILSQRPVNREVAMTGEMTLRGQVLSVGGIKEKLLAAVRAGMRTVVLPRRNEKDLVDVPSGLRRRLNLLFADRVDDVLTAALEEKR
jgi:ATP-dependent Lon protease